MMDMFKMLQDPNFTQGFASIGPTINQALQLLQRIATAIDNQNRLMALQLISEGYGELSLDEWEFIRGLSDDIPAWMNNPEPKMPNVENTAYDQFPSDR